MYRFFSGTPERIRRVALPWCMLVFVSQLLGTSVHAEPARFPTIALSAGIHAIQAEVAATEAQRQQGLMYRRQLAANEGMLFLFGASAGVCMWMKNTFIPLSAAFIDAQGRIVNIEDMQPESLTSHCGEKPVAYVLEMNQGWFRQRNIRPGMVISGLPPLR